MWLWSQPKTSFAYGIKRLVNCYKICAKKRRDYIEKLQILYLSQYRTFFFFFAVALRPNAGHGLLILEVSRSRTTMHHSR